MARRMKDFDGRLAYITGASSGIGLALARLLAARGADLVLIARDEARLAKAKADMEARTRRADQRVETVSLDVSDAEATGRVLAATAASLGAPDLLVCAAGINKHADHFRNITPAMFDEVISTNLYGARNVIHALLEPMGPKKGHVVIFSSAAGFFGMFGYTAYATSKAALIGFAESLRYELKPLGMPVTLVCPPEVDTPMNYDEAKTLPAEGRAQKNLCGPMLLPEPTALCILKAIRREKFFYVPGAMARLNYLVHRLTNGWVTRALSDAVIKRTRMAASADARG